MPKPIAALPASQPGKVCFLKAAKSKTAFIIWNTYNRRPDILARLLDCRALFIGHIINNRGPAWKYLFWVDYLYKSIYTLAYLFYHRPQVVFAQSPPSFAPMVCRIYCTLWRRKLVVDGHNNAFESPWISVPLYLRCMAGADSVLVHNSELEAHLRETYPKLPLFTLPDKIPAFKNGNGLANGHANEKNALPYLLVILSYAGDEPLAELFAAFKKYQEAHPGSVVFKMTGNYRRKPQYYEQYKDVEGIEFLGYVDNNEYERTLVNAAGIIALTTRPMTQQCAAMEALGAGVPMIVSRTDTNERLFFKGAILTDTDRDSIYRSLGDFLGQYPALRSEVAGIRDHWEERWQVDFQAFRERIGI